MNYFSDEKPKGMKRNLSISTTLFSGNLIDDLKSRKSVLSSTMSMKSLKSPKSVKNGKPVKLSPIKSIQVPKKTDGMMLSYKVPKTIIHYRIAHKYVADSSARECVFDKMAEGTT